MATPNFYDDADEETAALILQLQLEDAEELIQQATTSTTDGLTIDVGQAALAIFRDELQRAATQLQDRQLVRDINREVGARGVLAEDGNEDTAEKADAPVQLLEPAAVDHPVLEVMLPGVQPVVIDEALAQPALRAAPGPVNAQGDRPDQPVHEPIIITDQGTQDSVAACDDALPVELPSAAVEVEAVVIPNAGEPEVCLPREVRRRSQRHCTSCDDRLFEDENFLIPCSHHYCTGCITSLFSLSLVDETLFPPRCCKQPIPISSVSAAMPATFQREFEDKREEFETVDRTYCSDRRCSIFLRPGDFDGDKGTCPTCQKGTCVLCKAPWHEGEVCPADEATLAVVELARENGWQRCTGCKSMVSISHGCNHMRCRCGAEWCYACTVAWKQCACPQWEENLLLRRANEVANLEGPQEGLNRDEHVAAVINRIEVHCEHEEGWRHVRCGGQCDNCGASMPVFRMRCEQCRVHWCRRCMRNRG